MKMYLRAIVAAFAPAFVVTAVEAQHNAENAKQFKTAGIDTKAPGVPQAGNNAAAIKEVLKRIKLPPGFRIELFALAPAARQMAVDSKSNAVFVGTRRSTVWVVADHKGTGVAADVRPFAPEVRFADPNGVCLTRDGVLIVAERNQVLSFRAERSLVDGSDVMVSEVVPRGHLVPVEEETSSHGARVCRVGPDRMLYIALGQPYNVPPRDKLALYSKWGIGGIVRMDADDGSKREVYATGIRNCVGLDFNPKDNTLWFTDNQTDGMGDTIPPGVVHRATKPGQFFGYPWKQGRIRITEFGYDKDPLPESIVAPQVEMDAHAADLGMVFYNAEQFPSKYQGGFFSAQHGSWNRSKPIGARVMFTSVKADGTADKTEVFAAGWLDEATGKYLGRPVDVAVLNDGSLVVSDDFAGALYRISYRP